MKKYLFTLIVVVSWFIVGYGQDDITLKNAKYLKTYTSSGSSTRIFGLNQYNNMYLGGIDQSIQNLYYTNGGKVQFMITSEGKVGIGLAPRGSFHSKGSGANIIASFNDSHFQYTWTPNGDQAYIWSNTDDMKFGTSSGYKAEGWSEKLRITKEGDLGLGIISPLDKLHVNGSVRINRHLNFNYYTNESFNGNMKMFVNSDNRFIMVPYDKGWQWGKEFGYSTVNKRWYFEGDLRLTQKLSLGNNKWGEVYYDASTTGEGNRGLYFKENLSNNRGFHFVNSSGTELFKIQGNGNVGIGTTNPDQKLTVKGIIHAQEVQVDLAGAIAPDYVFEKYYEGASQLQADYTMPTLEEVAQFTKEYKHLPNIPSAQELEKNGMHLKEMTRLLLQKIEELTLYTIEQNKINKEQAQEIKELQSQLKQLK